MKKRIHLNGLRQNTVGHTAAGLWRHPDSQAHRYKDIDHWIETARILEAGLFDALFIADALGPRDVYQARVDAALKDGIQTPTDDPLLLISALGVATRSLAFAVTVSTTYEQPYAFARKMTTLDHLTNGRIGWNIVTSSLESAARNLGLSGQVPHDERYRRAEEFMRVVYALWEKSWDDDAVVFDREKGIFIDPEKVHAVGHKGEYFSVPDIALSAPSVQRTPVLFQAGSSIAGRSFATRHAEGIFISSYSPEVTRKLVNKIRRQAQDNGRSAEQIKIYNILTVIVAEIDEAAHEKYADYRRYVSQEGSLARFSALF